MELIAILKLLSAIIPLYMYWFIYRKGKQRGYTQGQSDTLKAINERDNQLYEKVISIINNPNKSVADVVSKAGATIKDS